MGWPRLAHDVVRDISQAIPRRTGMDKKAKVPKKPKSTKPKGTA